MKQLIGAIVISFMLHCALFFLVILLTRSSWVVMPKDSTVTVSLSSLESGPASSRQETPASLANPTPNRDLKKPTATRPKKAISIKPSALEPPSPDTKQSTEEPIGMDANVNANSKVAYRPTAGEGEGVGTVGSGDKEGDGVSNATLVKDAVPIYRRNPPPIYPQAARQRGYQGTVILDFLVSKTGTVSDLRIYKTSGYPVLDQAAEASAKSWLFEPGLRGNQPVEMWVRLPVAFRLE